MFLAESIETNEWVLRATNKQAAERSSLVFFGFDFWGNLNLQRFVREMHTDSTTFIGTVDHKYIHLVSKNPYH